MAESGETLQDMLRPRRSRLGLLVKPRGSPTLFSDLAARLRALALTAETPDARADVEAALGCPWWGLRVLAIQVLGRWGGRRNKEWLVARSNRLTLSYSKALGRPRGDPAKWHYLETVTARAALRPHLDGGDAGWLLDLWFADWEGFAGLHGAQHLLPVALVEARARQEFRHAAGDARHALFWLVASAPALPCRDEVLRCLARDDDEALARLARRALWRTNAAVP